MVEEKIIQKLKTCKQLAVLTGAGISAESGIPTFRGAGGYWKNYRAEDLATPDAFSKDPKLIWEWYSMRIGVCEKANSNPGHEVIAKMENYFANFLLVTQNVDSLHRRAGNNKILEIHGNIFTARCTKCKEKFGLPTVPEELPVRCPKCESLARPHIVWFGESYDTEIMSRAVKFMRNTDLIFVIGTSGQVGVPMDLTRIAIDNGAYSIEINPESSTISSEMDCVIREPAGIALPKIWEKFTQS
jgi:NAD-dependent deacetylase